MQEQLDDWAVAWTEKLMYICVYAYIYTKKVERKIRRNYKNKKFGSKGEWPYPSQGALHVHVFLAPGCVVQGEFTLKAYSSLLAL